MRVSDTTEPSNQNLGTGARQDEAHAHQRFTNLTDQEYIQQLIANHEERRQKIIKIILLGVAGTVMLIAGAIFLFYLKFVIPTSYVWPGISKLAAAAGVGVLVGGGFFLVLSALNSVPNHSFFHCRC